MHPDKLPPHIAAAIAEMRNAPASMLILKVLEGFGEAARSINAAKAITVPDSPLFKRYDDLDRALIVFIQNHIAPLAEDVHRDPSLLIKDA